VKSFHGPAHRNLRRPAKKAARSNLTKLTAETIRTKIKCGTHLFTLSDPDFQTPILTRDEERFVAFAWPKGKIREWLRAAE